MPVTYASGADRLANQEGRAQWSELPKELVERFQAFCQAFGEKADRIGRFVRLMEAREQYCRHEATQLLDRARRTEYKIERTKSMAMYFLMSRGLNKLEGRLFTFRIQRNSQPSVQILKREEIPLSYCRIDLLVDGALWKSIMAALPSDLAQALQHCVEASNPDTSAIKSAQLRNEEIPGAEVRRGYHLRVV